MSFKLVDEAKKEFSVHRLCRVLGVSQSGCFAWKGRPACRRQHEDMVLLAHVRSAFALSNGTYGSPRMTRDLRRRHSRYRPIHRRLLQSRPAPFRPRLHKPGAVRENGRYLTQSLSAQAG